MKKWLKISFWSIFIIGTIVLLVAIQRTQSELVINSPEIIVKYSGSTALLNEDEIKEKLKFKGLISDTQRNEELDIEAIEEFICGISQVKNVQVYKYIGKEWKIEIELRDPIARIFNNAGETFYIDDEGYTMTTTPNHTARIIVVSGDIDDKQSTVPVNDIINNDSLKSIRKLDEIYRISRYVCKDPLFSAMIGQIYVEKNGDFILVPLVGDQKIIFGSVLSEEDVSEKFKKLRIFYDEAISYEGWNTYSEISLKYRDQIVCKKIAL